MGEYKDGSLWIRLAFFFTILGFFLGVYGFDNAGGTNGSLINESGELALFVIGLLCMLVAWILIFGLVYWDELKDNKPALICFVVFALVAGLAMVIGAAIFGGDNHCTNNHGNGHNRCVGIAISLWVLSALCEILGGIFGILELAGVSAP